jgi:predicted ester cyclase
MEVVRAVEGADEVYVTGRFKGTHKGDLVCLRHHSRLGERPGHALRRLAPRADGKIVEHEVIWDQMGLVAQLGAVPPG